MRKADALVREFVTPEGVDLRLRLGSAGDRAGAFLLDCLIVLASIVALTVAAAYLGIASVIDGELAGFNVLLIVWLIVVFGLRAGWFIGWELTPRAATPGKRAVGLRVVARDGGRLTAGAIVARNALRELEVFVPLYLAISALAGDGDGWVALAGFAWAGVFLFLPLFNRDRLRAGDILAGTWVVRVPRVELGGDLVASRTGHWRFTEEQLDQYGEAEFERLEAVLRHPTRTTMIDVACTIAARIGVPVADGEAQDFLTAYHADLGERLERRALFGRRKTSKHDVLTFLPSQLTVYGEAERAALAQALGHTSDEALGAIAANVRRRIGWSGPEVDDRTFLESYRSALDQRIDT